MGDRLKQGYFRVSPQKTYVLFDEPGNHTMILSPGHYRLTLVGGGGGGGGELVWRWFWCVIWWCFVIC